MRLRVDRHCPFRSVEALVVDGLADGIHVVATGRFHRLGPKMNGDVSGFHGVGQDAFGPKAGMEAADEILVFRQVNALEIIPGRPPGAGASSPLRPRFGGEELEVRG